MILLFLSSSIPKHFTRHKSGARLQSTKPKSSLMKKLSDISGTISKKYDLIFSIKESSITPLL